MPIKSNFLVNRVFRLVLSSFSLNTSMSQGENRLRNFRSSRYFSRSLYTLRLRELSLYIHQDLHSGLGDLWNLGMNVNLAPRGEEADRHQTGPANGPWGPRDRWAHLRNTSTSASADTSEYDSADHTLIARYHYRAVAGPRGRPGWLFWHSASLRRSLITGPSPEVLFITPPIVVESMVFSHFLTPVFVLFVTGNWCFMLLIFQLW